MTTGTFATSLMNITGVLAQYSAFVAFIATLAALDCPLTVGQEPNGLSGSDDNLQELFAEVQGAAKQQPDPLSETDESLVNIFEQAREAGPFRFPDQGLELMTLKGQKVSFWNVGEVLGLAFSPDGTLLASTGCDGRVRLWNLKTRRNTITFTGHTHPAVTGVAFDPDGKRIASASSCVSVKWGRERIVWCGHILRVAKASSVGQRGVPA